MDFLKQSDEILTVSEFSRRFKMLLKTTISEFWISGEISNLKTYSSGHTYFTLKDEDASISAVLFKGNAKAISFPLKEGMKIFAFGEVTVYEQRGSYQFIVRTALADGAGDLSAKFNLLKKKLSDEGLFDSLKKKPIPVLPDNIAVITSPTGAAVQDFCRILTRRGWKGNLTILPSRVQGSEATAELISQLKFAQSYKFEDGKSFDLIVLTRGGGSLEDLWCFNEESLVRAIANCDIPIISAVGHEIDFTLSDFASDLRAETPSGAAEYISSSFISASQSIRDLDSSINRIVEYYFSNLRDKLASYGNIIRLNSPENKIQNLNLKLDDLDSKIATALQAKLHSLKSKLSQSREKFAIVSPENRINFLSKKLEYLSKHLKTLGIENTLKRGFSLTTDSSGKVITAKDISINDDISVQFADGCVDATAKKISKPN